VVGLQPVGAVLSGLLAEGTGSGTAIALSTAATLFAGVAALRLDIPILGRIEEPQSAGLDVKGELRDVEVTGPVIVRRTWHIADADIEEFLDTMRRARDIRRRVGARRWELHVDAIRGGLFTEVVHYVDWEEHLLQRTRLDTEDLAVLEHLRDLDVDGAPRTRLLIPVDL